MVKVKVALSPPRKEVVPFALETNKPRKRVIELRLAAAAVIWVAVAVVRPIVLNGPAPAAASRACIAEG